MTMPSEKARIVAGNQQAIRRLFKVTRVSGDAAHDMSEPAQLVRDFVGASMASDTCTFGAKRKEVEAILYR